MPTCLVASATSAALRELYPIECLAHGPYLFYYSLCINYLLCNIFNLLLLLLSPVCTIFCAQVNDSSRAVLSPRRTDIPRHLGWTGGLRQHFVNPLRGLRRHSAGLHWPCYVTTLECRALRSATSGPAWGWNLVPHQARTASSMPNTLTS